MSIYENVLPPATVYQLFPTPVYIDNIGREFNKTEHEYWVELEGGSRRNEGNFITPQERVLDSAQFAHIRVEVEKRLEDYVDRVLSPSQPLELYITQSWINYTHEGEYHHQHAHSNSLVSGVVYLNTDDQDRIYFHKPDLGIFDFNVKDHNIFNSTAWFFPVHTGDIVMFPSQLEHNVARKTTPGTRVSIAFNTWFRGELGSAHNKTYLCSK